MEAFSIHAMNEGPHTYCTVHTFRISTAVRRGSSSLTTRCCPVGVAADVGGELLPLKNDSPPHEKTKAMTQWQRCREESTESFVTGNLKYLFCPGVSVSEQ